MAGYVKSEIRVYKDGTLSIHPDKCPVEDVHRLFEPMCYSTLPENESRSCMYWMASTSPGNTSERVHPTQLRVRAVALGSRSIHCGVICARQRANRPPGC
jgi:hypothetical protein